MADLSVTLCGLKLKNPLILSSGPLSWNAEGIQAAFAAGAAAVVTKTIRPQATVNPVPHIAAVGHRSLLNTEGWSDLPARQWIERELPALAHRDGVLIASAGHTRHDVEQLAGPLAQAGVDMLEVVSYKAEDAARMVVAAKSAVSIPVLVKVSANWPSLVDVVDACLRAGADGITAIDSVGPALRLDVRSGRPLLGSFAWLSGAAILPIALWSVAATASRPVFGEAATASRPLSGEAATASRPLFGEAATASRPLFGEAAIGLRHPVPVVGTGGVARPEDIVEMVMAGASAVGVHTAPLLEGLDWFGKTLTKLERWLDDHGHSRLADLRGMALPYLQEAVSHTPLTFAFDSATWTQCGRCVSVCAYRARQLVPGPGMVLDRQRCRSCGLCVSVCPTGALQA
jgi:dihydroorotate dehydrogenase/NAD-dependent dihydropyrimidine dehydrogenase PreA subunit